MVIPKPLSAAEGSVIISNNSLKREPGWVITSQEFQRRKRPR